MSKKFSDEDILIIKRNLKNACEDSWRIRGYKQTNIPLLTKEVGISSGAFYLIYDKKEELFVEVLEEVQRKLLNTWSTCINESTNKIEGFREGMMWIYNEYKTYPTLYNLNSSEYELFLAKLPDEKVEELESYSITIFEDVIKASKLRPKLPEEQLINILHSILFLALVDQETLTGTQDTFEFLLDHVLYDLFKGD